MNNPGDANTGKNFEFDIALSFAGEDRKIAEELALLLIERNVRVFYDFHRRAELWGKDHQHLRSIYRDKSCYCIILVSKAFKDKKWTRYELKQAQAREVQDGREYVLALRLDDTDLPELNPTDFYEDLRTTNLNQICDLVIKKLEGNYNDSEQAASQWTIQPPESEKVFVKKSFHSYREVVGRNRIPRLILIWVQLILFCFLYGGIGGLITGGVLILTMLLIIPLSILMSRLVGRDILLSILVGGLVNGILVSAVAFSLNTGAVREGILFGVFFGASLTVYFSRTNKNATLFTALINTCLLISATWILLCSDHHRICLEILIEDPEHSVRLAGVAVVSGLSMALIIKPLNYLLEALVDKIVEAFSGFTDQQE